MSAKPPVRQAPGSKQAETPSTAPFRQRSLRWVRDVLSRTIRLEQRRDKLHVVLVDPRRAAPAEPLSPLMEQRAELGARLLVHDPATQAVRNLFIVHDELRSGGWPAVEALPLPVLGRALTEAEILAVHEPSAVLSTIIESLRALQLAAEERAAREALDREWETPQAPEVSDTNFDEYELMERSWAGTVPAGLDRPNRHGVTTR